MNSILVNEYAEIYADLGDIYAELTNARILITGATGLIGAYIVDFLLYMNEFHGLNMQIFATSTSGEKLIQRFGCASGGLHFIIADFCAPTNRLGTFDYIIHSASPAHPDAYLHNPVGVMKANIIGTISLLDNIIGTHTRFVFISSGEIYGHNIAGRPFVETDVGAVDTMSLRACYPEAKRAAETLCVSYMSQYNADIVVVRPGHVYGPGVIAENNRADAQFLRSAIAGEMLKLTGDGMQTRTWCYVADAVSAILRVMMRGTRGGAYNIGTRESVATLRVFAETMARMAGVCASYGNASSSGEAKPDSILDGTRLIGIGWRAKYNLERGLAHTLAVKMDGKTRKC